MFFFCLRTFLNVILELENGFTINYYVFHRLKVQGSMWWCIQHVFPILVFFLTRVSPRLLQKMICVLTACKKILAALLEILYQQKHPFLLYNYQKNTVEDRVEKWHSVVNWHTHFSPQAHVLNRFDKFHKFNFLSIFYLIFTNLIFYNNNAIGSLFSGPFSERKKVAVWNIRFNLSIVRNYHLLTVTHTKTNVSQEKPDFLVSPLALVRWWVPIDLTAPSSVNDIHSYTITYWTRSKYYILNH